MGLLWNVVWKSWYQMDNYVQAKYHGFLENNLDKSNKFFLNTSISELKKSISKKQNGINIKLLYGSDTYGLSWKKTV